MDRNTASPCAEDPAVRLDALYKGFQHRFVDVPEVTVQQLRSWLEQASEEAARAAHDAPPPSPPVVLVDVRTSAEQRVSMIPGPVVMTQREFEASDPERFRGSRIVCYCTAGYRSGLLVKKLRAERGLDAYNLRGSILAWTQAGYPLSDPRDGSATTRVHVFSKDWALQGKGYVPVMFRRPLVQLLLDVVGGWWSWFRRRLLCGAGKEGGSDSGRSAPR